VNFRLGLVILLLGCTNPSPQTPVEPTVAAPAPKPVRSLVPKMQALEATFKRLIEANAKGDQTAAYEAAVQLELLAQSVDHKTDLIEGYGAQFPELVLALQNAAKELPAALKGGAVDTTRALRHLHDQCLRCHDQAPAAEGASVCQLLP
jgi:hypothetical protein